MNEIQKIINEIGSKDQMSKKEYDYIVSLSKDKKILVFGTGADTDLWRKVSSYCVFLENEKKWIPKNNNNVFLIEYTCKIENYKKYFNDLIKENYEDFYLNLPRESYDDWDVILVDAPSGYARGQHGRMQSIYAAYCLCNSKTDVIIHDYNRTIEKMFCDKLFTKKIKNFDKLIHVKK